MVGWYDGARIYRKWREAPPYSQRYKLDYWYMIEGNAQDSKLIPEDKRTKKVPIQIRNYCFLRDDSHQEARQDLLKYIENFSKIKRKSLRPKYSHDIFKKIEVEKSAIELVINYYCDAGYEIKSVEKDNLGWDLEASYDETVLKLEVKGLSGNEVIVQLTPNEYEKMCQNIDDYRLCIVTNTLDRDKRDLKIYSYYPDTECWTNIENPKEVLEIQEKHSVSAMARSKEKKMSQEFLDDEDFCL